MSSNKKDSLNKEPAHTSICCFKKFNKRLPVILRRSSTTSFFSKKKKKTADLISKSVKKNAKMSKNFMNEFFFRILKISRPHRRIRFNLAENLNFCFKKFVSIEITGRLYLNFDSFMNSAQSVFSFLQISLVFQSACRSVLFMNS